MIRCVYTTQKHKKLKTWVDGFVRLKGKKFQLYDSEMVNIHSSVVSSLDNEMEVSRYLIYIESFDDQEEDRETVPPSLLRDVPPTIASDSKEPSGTCRNEQDQREAEAREDGTRTPIAKGRTKEEIMGLFGK